MNKLLVRVAAVALLCSSTGVMSAPVTYDFSVTATSGPLTGDTQLGFFTFDDSIIPPGGGAISVVAFVDFSFTWNSISYDETTANTNSLEFDPLGDLEKVTFGNDCYPGFCGVSVGTNEWFAQTNNFVYTLPAGGIYAGDVTYARRSSPPSPPPPAEVPEPTTLTLLGLGLAGMGFTRRRRKPTQV